MTKLRRLVGSWVCGLALVGVGAGCTPRTDIGVGPNEASGGEGVSSPQAGSGGGPIDGEGGSPEGGTSGSSAGSSAAAGGDLAGGNGGSTTSGGNGGTSGAGGDSGSTGTGGSAGTDTGGSAGTDTGGSAGTDTGGSAGTATGGTSSQAGSSGNTGGQDHCNLDPEVYEDDSPSTPSSVPCGRLGDLSAATGFALDVGHATAIKSLSQTATRLLSYDSIAAWVLWDVEGKIMVRRGKSQPYPRPRTCDFCVVPFPSSPVLSDTHFAALATIDARAFHLQLRSALDGDVIATLTPPGLDAESHFGFASDGSYLWAATTAGISAWSMGGDLLAEVSGNFQDASISAVPGELRVALPTRNVIERISTATGGSTLSQAFQGTFHSWFVDGARFLTTISNTVRVYSGATVTQEKIFNLPRLDNLTGQGDHVWTFGNLPYTLDIYALADTSAPAATIDHEVIDHAFPAGNRIGIVKYGVPSIDIIELGPTITQSSVDVPSYYNQIFTADDAGNWTLGGNDGELFESTDLARPLSCGAIKTIARADDGMTAVGTAAGGILLFKLTAASRQYLGTIPFPSGHVELSRDGLVLAATASSNHHQYQADVPLRVFSLPDRSEVKTWPYIWNNPQFFGFSMSSQGNRFGHHTGVFDGSNHWTHTLEVRDLADQVSLSLTGSVSVDDIDSIGDNPPRLSADGTRVAVASGDATNVYENGVLINAFPGRPLGWFDDGRLLVDLDGAYRVYDTLGQLQPTADLRAAPVRFDTRIVSATEVYSELGNAIYSLTSGDKLWSCGESWGPSGAAAASYTVFVSKQAPHKLVFDHY